MTANPGTKSTMLPPPPAHGKLGPILKVTLLVFRLCCGTIINLKNVIGLWNLHWVTLRSSHMAFRDMKEKDGSRRWPYTFHVTSPLIFSIYRVSESANGWILLWRIRNKKFTEAAIFFKSKRLQKRHSYHWPLAKPCCCSCFKLNKEI